ncbi:MAG TPA: class I tRNA ligase family protein, partial [Polyangiaceae bacterium]
LQLPELEDYQPGDPQGPLSRALDWRFFQKDGRWFARETNTMPQWAGSCWYYLRYLDPRNTKEIFSQQSYDDWMPVDLYVGGNEHAVLHLLYARFWHKVLFDLGIVKHAEPFTRLVHQGLILGMVYRYYVKLDATGAVERAIEGDAEVTKNQETGQITLNATREQVEARWATEKDVIVKDGGPVHRELDVRVVPLAEKMSKSRGNVVNPDTVVEEFGADSLRLYEMFMGPLEQAKPWQTSGIQGVRRYLDRLVNLAGRPISNDAPDAATTRLMHKSIKKIGEDIDALRLNTAVSTMMIWLNQLATYDQPPRAAVEALVLCTAPFAPHVAEELWEQLGHQPSVAHVAWPTYDPALCEDAQVEMAVQVNGKMRGRITLPKDADAAVAQQAALDDPNVRRFIGDKAVKKTIYVPGKILNVIIA